MQTTRREFIKQMGFVSIGFSLTGVSCLAMENRNSNITPKAPEKNRIDSWLRILENGKIQIFTGKLELGQGIRTAVMQVAAEELDTNLNLIEVNLAETGITPDEGFTAGSNSIESSAMAIRNAAASAREILLNLASKKLEIPVSKLRLKDGKVLGPNNELALYELLQGQQLTETIGNPTLYKGKTVRKYVGKPIKRKDIDAMVRGHQIFVQDLRFPNMVHARVVHPPSYTSKLKEIDESTIEKLPGFLKLVRKGSFVGVLAQEEYHAVQLQKKIKQLTKWVSADYLPEGQDLSVYLKTISADIETHDTKGSADSSLENSKIKLKASFFKPYLMHAANGPSCAVALFEKGKLHVWSHCQGAYPLRGTLASLFQMAEDDVHVKAVPGSGCFGHNGANDVATEAALMAFEYPGRHIRLQWMRDDENGWEPYGTAMIVDVEAGLNENGKIEAWQCNLWSDGHSNRPNGNPNTLLPAHFLDKDYGNPGIGYRGGAYRNAAPYYTIPNLTVRSHMFQGPLRASSLRSLGTYTNIFAIESVIDELAHLVKKDPMEFRLLHSEDDRAISCMRTLQAKVIDVPIGQGEGLGYAFSRYKNATCYCAMAAKVAVDRTSGKVVVKKMWAVVDAGETINPDGLKNQVEGGMIQSASWALKEEVKFDARHITSLDWNSYPILRFPEVPEVDVEVVDRVDQPPVGAGEASQAPATAAIVNAIFDATGVRIRRLPVDPELLKA